MRRILPLLLSFTIISAASAGEDSVAVIIGNSDYQGSRIPAVDYAQRDAGAIRRYLIDVQGYRPGNIIDIRNATQAQMIAAFGNDQTHEGKLWQFIRAGESDVTVYYSGHGVPGRKNRRGYLLPVNADPNRPELNGYSLDTLITNLTKLPAKTVTIFIDACFTGDSPKGPLVQAASGISVMPRASEGGENLVLLTAASGGQLASWDTQNRHGLFTEHLLNALYGAADTDRYGKADKTVTLGEVGQYLERHMTYAAKRAFGRVQNATIQGNRNTALSTAEAIFPRRPQLDETGQPLPVSAPLVAERKTSPPIAAVSETPKISTERTAQNQRKCDLSGRWRATYYNPHWGFEQVPAQIQQRGRSFTANIGADTPELIKDELWLRGAVDDSGKADTDIYEGRAGWRSAWGRVNRDCSAVELTTVYGDLVLERE